MKFLSSLTFNLITLLAVFCISNFSNKLYGQKLDLNCKGIIIQIPELLKTINIIQDERSNNEFDTIILNNQKSINVFSGEIKIGDNYLPQGEIFLFNYEKGVFNTITPAFITNGKFTFTNLTNDEYFFYIIPHFDYNVLYYPKYLPTYSGNTHTWQNSKMHKIESGHCIIDMVSYDIPFYGSNTIEGKVKYSKNYSGIENIPVVVFLLNDSFVPMDFRIADKYTGEYSFNYIPHGRYYIHPEIPGIKTEDFEVNVINNENNENVDFLIESDIIKPEIENRNDGEFRDGFIEFNLNMKIFSPLLCELYATNGLCVLRQMFYSERISIHTFSFNPGIYILNIRSLDNSYSNTKKIYINNHL
jgi:hypothetical protein